MPRNDMGSVSLKNDPGVVRRSAARVLFSLPRNRAGGQAAPAELIHTVEDPWTGDAALAEEFMQGSLTLGGNRVEFGSDYPWRRSDIAAEWVADFNGFEWIRNVAAVADQAVRRQLGELISAWLHECADWHGIRWRADVVGRRLVSWLGHIDLICHPKSDGRAEAITRSLIDQANYLNLVAGLAPNGSGRATAALGLIAAGVCLPNGQRKVNRGLKILTEQIQIQILADGGHVSRNPTLHHDFLRDLILAREYLLADGANVPELLDRGIEKMGRMLRFFQHRDRTLGLFNGGTEGDKHAVSLTLIKAGTAERPPVLAEASGFCRLEAGGTLILLDGGRQDAAGNATGHAGMLAMEMSVDNERLIVNCGGGMSGDPEWSQALAATAAHSAVTIGDRNSVVVQADGRLGRDSQSTATTYNDEESQLRLDAKHDGYRRSFGVQHLRRLSLDETGYQLRGEDHLLGETGTEIKAAGYAVRFHLHPDVTVSNWRDDGLLLQTPAGVFWHLRCDDAEMAVEDSLYAGQLGRSVATRQIVISGQMSGPNTHIRWTFTRLLVTD